MRADPVDAKLFCAPRVSVCVCVCVECVMGNVKRGERAKGRERTGVWVGDVGWGKGEG